MVKKYKKSDDYEDERTEYPKIRGTKIQYLKGGVAVRVTADGKEFAPNDVVTAQRYVDKLNASEGHWEWEEYPPVREKPSKGKGKNRPSPPSGPPPIGMRPVRDDGYDRPPKMWEESVRKSRGKGRDEAKGKGKGKGKDKGRVIKKHKRDRERRERTDLTEEELEERRIKREERAAAKAESEGRELVGSEYIEGEVVQANKMFAWVRPLYPEAIPEEVQESLQTMNDDFRARAVVKSNRPFCGGVEENVVYIRNTDIVEDGLRLEPGMSVQFLFYTDSKGVGGCEVISA